MFFYFAIFHTKISLPSAPSLPPLPPPMQYIVASFLNGILKDFFFPVLCAIVMCTDKRTVWRKKKKRDFKKKTQDKVNSLNGFKKMMRWADGSEL